MATLQFTLEHPKGSGLSGAVYSISDTKLVKTDHGRVPATSVQVGWSIYTCTDMSAKVLVIATD